MSNETKHYFLAPSWDYPPNGPISLGNIVRRPDKLIPPLYAHTPAAGDEQAVPLCQKSGVDYTRAKATEKGFGVYLKFLEQFVGAGIDAGGKFRAADDSVFRFETVDTQELFPDDAAIRPRVKSPAVKSYLEKCRFQRSVYMIVGIKTVTGATARSMAERERGGEFAVGVDATLFAGVPVSVGPKVAGKTAQRDGMAFERSEDFVFAYRLRKVRVSENDEVIQSTFSKGALLGNKVGEVPVEETFTVLGLEDQDASAADFELAEQEWVMDGEEKVQVVVQESSG